MGKFLKCVGLVCLVGAIFVVIVNLPMQQVTDVVSTSISFEEGEYPFQSHAMPLPVAAGWPETFYRRYEDIDSVEPFVDWNPMALLRNLGIGFGLCFAFGCLEYLRRRAGSRPTSESQDKESSTDPESEPKVRSWRQLGRKKVRYSLADIILVTLVIAIPLGYYQLQRRLYESDLKISLALSTDVSVQREALMPELLKKWAPSWLFPFKLRGYMQRTTVVRLNEPDEAQVRMAMSLPHLRGLVIGGGDYNLEVLASLPNRKSLTVLHLMGRPLDDATLSRIRLMDNLRSLNLHRTNVTHQSIERLFADRPVAAERLRLLNVVDSGVDLSGLSDSKALASMKSLQILGLPTPIPGEGAEFKLPPLPELFYLIVSSRDRGKNTAVTKLEIADCPELKTMLLGSMQKFSLNLARLPKLASLEPDNFKTKLRLAANQSVPLQCWFESIVVDDLPSLETLQVYATDLKEFRFTKTPKFQFLGPGVFQAIGDGDWSSNKYDQTIPAQATKALVEGISESDGPEVIDYASVPLGDADLTPLMKNRRLKALYLHQCGLTLSSIRQLMGSETLQAISTQGNDLGNLQIGELITQLPHLQRWHGDLYAMDRLRIENHQHIQGVVDCQPEEGGERRCHLLGCSALRLANLPEWTDPIRMDATELRYVTIENLPKLKQLVINCPLCDKAVLSGLTGISLIAVGGPEVDDELIADWSTYKDLRSIALHATSITAGSYQKLLEGRSLTRMDFRHEKVDDKAILSIIPNQLDSVTLVDTGATSASVRHILGSQFLTELNVSDIALTPDLIDPILQLGSLKVLGIDASGWTPQQISAAAGFPVLEHLILKNAKIDKSVAKEFPHIANLKHLTLIDSTVDGPAMAELLNKAPNMKLELSGSEIPSLLEGELLEAQRLVFDSEPEEGPYARGPDGLTIAIQKEPRIMSRNGSNQGNSFFGGAWGMMGMMGMPNSQRFVPMSEELFSRLSPIAFEVVDEDALDVENPEVDAKVKEKE